MKCKQCDTGLVNKREGAKYCDHNCRQKYFNRKKKIRDRIEWLERTGRMDETIRSQKVDKLARRERSIESQIAKIVAAREETESRLCWLEVRLGLNLESFAEDFEAAVRRNPHKHPTSYNIIMHGNDQQYWSFMQSKKAALARRHDELQAQFHRSSNLLEKLRNELKVIATLIESVQTVSESELAEAEERQQEIEELKLIDLENLPPQVRKGPSPENGAQLERHAQAHSPSDILSKTFEGVQFAG